jgi:hypothetical protein
MQIKVCTKAKAWIHIRARSFGHSHISLLAYPVVLCGVGDAYFSSKSSRPSGKFSTNASYVVRHHSFATYTYLNL